jgi:hypothetical protein
MNRFVFKEFEILIFYSKTNLFKTNNPLLIDSISGQCMGKIRSTPIPFAMRRTVIVEFRPARCWRITVP